MKIKKWHPIFALMVALNTTMVPGLLLNQKIRAAGAQTVFEDIQDNWAKNCIQELIEKEIISGYYEDKTFRPNSLMTRGQFAATIARAFPNAELVREEMNFVDVPTDFWAADAIQKAYRTGFMSGYIAKSFNPTLEMSRAEVLMSLVKGLKYQNQELKVENLSTIFDDAAQIPEGAQEAIAAATERGIVVNYPDVRKLAPTRKATRAEVAGFLCQALANPGGNNQVVISKVPSEYIPKINGEIASTPPNPIPTPSPPTPKINYNAIETVQVGNIIAEVAYQKDDNSQNGKNFRLKIVRDGKTVLEEMLFKPANTGINGADSEQVATGKLLKLKLEDLDGDKELEVLVDVAIANSSMPKGSYSFIFDNVVSGTENKYQKVEHYWGEFEYNLTDLDENNIPEFQGVDDRFANAFANNNNASFLPLKIWQYRQGKMIDITKDFPIEINTHSSEIWQELNRRVAANEEIKGILAAYIANKYILGGEQTVWKLVDKLYQGSDREAYFASVRQFLLANGYSKNDGTNPLPNPLTPTATSPQTQPPSETDSSETNPVKTNPLENLQEELEKRISESSPTSSTNNSETNTVDNTQEQETEKTEETADKTSDEPSTNPTVQRGNNQLDLPQEEKEETTAMEDKSSEAETNPVENSPKKEVEETISETNEEEKLEVSPKTETQETTTIVLDEKPQEVTDGAETTVAETSEKTSIAPQLVRSLSDDENKPVLSLAISLDGEILASSSGKEIKLWEVETGKLLRTMSGSMGDVRTLAISPDGEALASGSGDGTIRFWKVETGELLDTISNVGWVTAVGFSDRGNKLLSSAAERSLQVWDVWQGRSLYTLNGIGPIAFARNGNLAATGGGRSALRLWNVPAGLLLRNIAIPTSKVGATAIALTEDGETLVNAISESSRIFVWNLETGELRHTLDGHEGEIDAIVTSPDGKLLATSSADGTIKLWELASGKMLKTIEGKGAIVFSPDSETLIGVGGDNQIQVWGIYAP